MLYILLGQDDFSLQQSLGKIKASVGDQTLLSANTTTFDGHKVTVEQLKAVCETVPFLAEKRLAIIRGLLERFEPSRKSGEQKKSRGSQLEDCKAWAACIGGIPENTILVLIDSNVKRSNPLFRELSSKAEVKAFPLLKDTRKLGQWIEKRVAGESGSISPRAVDLMVKLVGSDLWAMANEIDKLILFTTGRRIEEEDVKAVVSHTQQANVFAMVDAILDFKAGIAEQSLHQLLQVGTAPAYLLVMLSRQVHMIVRAKELKNQGKSEGEIRNRLGFTYDFALRKTLDQAARYSLGRLIDTYNKLLEADLAIKTGRYEGGLALDILVNELCHSRKLIKQS